jgi:hypothetical protein
MLGEKIFISEKNSGSMLNVIVEDKIDAITGLYTGLTDNYIRVNISGAKRGAYWQEILVRITMVTEAVTTAEFISNYFYCILCGCFVQFAFSMLKHVQRDINRVNNRFST